MGPLAADQEAVWVPLAHNSLGIGSIKDPNCALAADRRNASLVDPIRLGRLYSATATSRSDGTRFWWPGSVRDKKNSIEVL